MSSCFIKLTFSEVIGKDHLSFTQKVLSLNAEEWQEISFDVLKAMLERESLFTSVLIFWCQILAFLMLCSSCWVKEELSRPRDFSKAKELKTLQELVMGGFFPGCRVPLGCESGSEN